MQHKDLINYLNPFSIDSRNGGDEVPVYTGRSGPSHADPLHLAQQPGVQVLDVLAGSDHTAHLRLHRQRRQRAFKQGTLEREATTAQRSAPYSIV